MIHRLFALVGLAVALAAPAAVASEHFCRPVVEREIDRVHLDRADIRKIFIIKKLVSTNGGEDSRVVGYNAWVDLKSCRGSMVVRLYRNCRVITVYTRHECRVPGVRHSC